MARLPKSWHHLFLWSESATGALCTRLYNKRVAELRVAELRVAQLPSGDTFHCMVESMHCMRTRGIKPTKPPPSWLYMPLSSQSIDVTCSHFAVALQTIICLIILLITSECIHLQSSSVLEENSVWQCYESGSISFIFDLIIFIYLGLLQLVGIILSFQTRKVKIPILNDSKSVATLIYISSIVLVVIVLITFILRGYINVTATIFSGGILLLASIFIALIFIPKVHI